MKQSSDQPKMAGILPGWLKRRFHHFAEERIPLRWADRINRFRVQTRLIFSRAVLMLVLALFVAFTWIVVAQVVEEKFLSEAEASIIFYVQVGILAIVLHMNLWEQERENRTFELLIMRVPETGRLIWLKLRVSLFWVFFLSLPFHIALCWFASLPVSHSLVHFLFAQTSGIGVALTTCAIASYVKRGLPTGLITAAVLWMFGGFTEVANFFWFKDSMRPFTNPFHEERFMLLTDFEYVLVLVLNRLFVVGLIALAYIWLKTRLSQTEKWVQ